MTVLYKSMTVPNSDIRMNCTRKSKFSKLVIAFLLIIIFIVENLFQLNVINCTI